MSKHDDMQIIHLLETPNGGSDVNLKYNVHPLENVLDKVLALRPVTWRWKAKHDDTATHYGFIAQEVEKLFPQIVKDGRWHGKEARVMSTHDLLPYAIKAIKEQNSSIESAQKQIAELTAELQRLKLQLKNANQ